MRSAAEFELVSTYDGRPLYVTSIARFADWPESVPAELGAFVAVVVADARAASGEALAEFSRRLLEQQLLYLCAWGPGCERVHDALDFAQVKAELGAGAELPVVMTTWHDEEALAETLWFAVVPAVPADALLARHPGPNAVVAIVVGSEAWVAEARSLLAAPEALLDKAEEAERARGG